MLDNPTTVDLLFQKVTNLFNTSINLTKLKLIQTSTDLLANFMAYFVFVLFILLGLAFGSIALASWLNVVYHSQSLGYFIVSLGYLLLAILAFIVKITWIKTPLQNSMIRKAISSIELNTNDE